MDRRQWLTLLLGPVPIITGAVALSRLARPIAQPAVAHNRVLPAGPWSAARDGGGPPQRQSTSSSLSIDCQRQALKWQRDLGDEFAVIVREPFVLVGNLDANTLTAWYDETLRPSARAMQTTYFTTAPHKPVSVLLFADEASYGQYAQQLFGDEQVSVYGYYKPEQHTLVLNAATGRGTLVHELTHALASFDFPAMPDWFNEGLASLHEQCRFRADGSGLDGLPNWRLPGLQKAIRRGVLRPLHSLLTEPEFRGSQVGLNYAHARYFCMFMQQCGVLADCYRRLRDTHAQDPHGLHTVRAVFGNPTWDELDARFRQWVLDLEYQPD
jgi:hypothetical protein